MIKDFVEQAKNVYKPMLAHHILTVLLDNKITSTEEGNMSTINY